MSAGELWLELPPMSDTAPRRLLVFLHAAGSQPEALAPFALAWQLKFPGALAAVLQGLEPAAAGGAGFDWYRQQPLAGRKERIDAAVREAATRIEALQRSAGVTATETVIVGWSQGATLAIELARRVPALAAIVVAYAARLARPLDPNEHVLPVVHLLHGEFDSVVPVDDGRRAYSGLRAGGTDVSLDVLGDCAHELGPAAVALGTTRVMQTIFRGKRAPVRGRGASLPRQ